MPSDQSDIRAVERRECAVYGHMPVVTASRRLKDRLRIRRGAGAAT